MYKRIVISGWGIVSPFGLSNQDFESNFDNKLAYSKKEDWELEHLGPHYFGAIPEFDILKQIDSLRPPFPNRYSSIGLLACMNALKDAGLAEDIELTQKAGLVITTTLGASTAIQSYLSKLYKKGPDRVSPFNFSKATSNSILGDISRILGLKGPGSLVYGEESVIYGVDLINNDHTDIVLCGGVDEITELNVLLADKKARLVSPNGTPTYEHLINDTQKDQSIFSEAASFVVIESLESAKKRGAKIYAEIVDYKQFRDQRSSKVIFERCTDSLRHNLNELLNENQIKDKDPLLFYGSACLPWHIQSYEWKALSKLSFEFTYGNVKASIGEGLSGSNNCTLVSTLLAHTKGRLANVLKEAVVLGEPPKNIFLVPFNPKEEFTSITHTFSVGGSNTLLMLKSMRNDQRS